MKRLTSFLLALVLLLGLVPNAMAAETAADKAAVAADFHLENGAC